jgi:ring-1,2-phenylacetyl-CoA epoxidase subunit PaaD
MVNVFMNYSNQNIVPIVSGEEEKVWNILSSVNDPEIPVLSILDLGIVRDVKMHNEIVEVIITPTYSGCPAMDFIGMNIKKALSHNGFHNLKITHHLSPAWTTDWMTEEGKEKLKAYGISPPAAKTFDKNYLENLEVECPHCYSHNTEVVSQFGSTACKALYKCIYCGEPFDYFKCH